MASTYTDIGTELMTTGENAGNWGTKTNTNLKIIEEAVRGYISQSIAGGVQTTTLTYTDGTVGQSDAARNMIIALTGTITGNQTIHVTAKEKLWVIDNQTTGAYTVNIKVSGQTGVTWAATDKGTKILYCNGTDVIDTGISSTGAFDLDGNEFILDADADTSITADTDDQIDIKIAGADDFQFTANTFTAQSGSTIAAQALTTTTITASGIIKTDSTTAATSTTDGSLQTDGGLSVAADAIIGDDLKLLSDSAVLSFGADSDTTLTHTDGTGLTLNSTNKLLFRDTGLYINSSTDGQLDIVADTEIQIAATTVDINGAIAMDGAITGATNITLSGELDAATLDISGNADIDGTTNLDIVDIDGAVQVDSTITVGADDQGYDVKFFGDTASAYMMWDTSTDDLVLAGAAGIDLAGDIDVDGTANLDAVDIDGAVQLDSTLTIGANDQGYDVILYGDTASANLTWDTSADDLILNGAARIVVPDSGLVLGSTAVTTTAAEINLIDGGASTGTTAVADADGILTNDGGTMRLTTAATFKTYFQSGVTASSIAADDISAGDAAVTLGNGSTSADVTIDSGDDVVIDAAGGNVEFKDAGTTQLTLDMDGTGGAQVIQLRVDTDDLIFKQFDGTTVLTLDDDTTVKVATDLTVGDDLTLLSDSAVLGFGADTDTTLTHTDGTGLTLNSTNKLCFNDATQFIQGASGTVLDIAATDEIELTATLIDVVGNLAGSGTATFGGILKTDDATEATSTTDGSLQTDGGLSVVKDVILGDDVTLLSDAAVLKFGADAEVTLTHVHNDGLLLNTDMQLQFRDSAINIRSDADGDLDINADDELELNSTLIDVNGNLDVSGTLAQAGVATFSVAANVAQVALTSSSNAVAWDASAAANAYHITTENTTFSAPSNAVEGAFICLELNFNGSHTIGWNTVFEFAASTEPTETATDAKTDIHVFRYNGAVWQEVGRTLNLSES